jgi:hypothetical protein
VGAGLALGLAYLTRYEALAPAAACAALVAVVSWWRASGTVSARLGVAANEVVLVTAPFAFTFALWAAMARVLGRAVDAHVQLDLRQLRPGAERGELDPVGDRVDGR